MKRQRPRLIFPFGVHVLGLGLGVSSGLQAADSPAVESIELIGIAEIDGQALDASEETSILQNGEPANRLGGFSAIDYTGHGNFYRVLPDRGPDDGATSYQCRSHLMEIVVIPADSNKVTARLVSTDRFTDAAEQPFFGRSAISGRPTTSAIRLDPEGLRMTEEGGYYVSDEYGPTLLEFSQSGQQIRQIPLPAHLKIRFPAETKDEENSLNNSGRASNNGMEGLAISRDGRYLVGLMQQALIQDSRVSENGKLAGDCCRLLKIDRASNEVLEFVYQLESPEYGTNEILAYGDDEYLVIEKDSKAGSEAAFRKLMKVSIAEATDIATESVALKDGLPNHIKPVRKSEFVDFLDPQFGLAGAQMPEKIEGLAFGPTLPDGRQTLIVAIDNDFQSERPSAFWVFAVSTLPHEDLPGE